MVLVGRMLEQQNGTNDTNENPYNVYRQSDPYDATISFTAAQMSTANQVATSLSGYFTLELTENAESDSGKYR